MTTGVVDRARPPFSPWEWVPALLLGVWGVLDATTSDAVVGSRPLLAVGVAVAAALLLLRCRMPLVVLLGVGVAVLGPATVGTVAQSAPGVLVLVVAVFSLGRYGRRPLSYLGLPVGMAFALVGSAADPQETLASSWTWSLNVVWILGIGLWLNDADRRVDETRRRAEADRRAAAAEERLRVARDLHDVLAHSLSLMVVQAEVADELLGSDPERARAALGTVQETGRAALRETRGVLGSLRTDDPGPSGTGHLPRLVGLFRSAGLPVELTGGVDLHLDPAADEAVYRMVQEALTNALRHCGPSATRVDLGADGDEVRVRVSNAPGARPGPPAEPGVPGGHGLLGMRERIESCGGRLRAGPLPDGGFAVEAVLPRSAVPS